MSMNSNQFDKILNAASKKSGADKQSIKKAIQTGDFNNVLNKLNPTDKNQIEKIMNDKEVLEKIFNSPQAQQLIKQLNEGKN
ncbi:MAG: hypothetical protein UHN02_01235 [Acutalibacteraceae bacterium]|nr:hypothetical protein [Acutalibacteraceae bacterium]